MLIVPFRLRAAGSCAWMRASIASAAPSGYDNAQIGTLLVLLGTGDFNGKLCNGLSLRQFEPKLAAGVSPLAQSFAHKFLCIKNWSRSLE